jgi:hypothetical protein
MENFDRVNRLLETGRQARRWRVHMHVSWQCTYTVFLLQCKLDILVEFIIGYLKQCLRSTSVYCDSLYIKCRVPVDGIRLEDVCLMVFNATSNNISVISWRSVSLVEKTRENHRPVASHRQTLSHNITIHLNLILCSYHDSIIV